MTQIRAQEPELDCSDAAKMLIQRMQTHPEDFDYGGKLYRMAEQAQMSARDKKACSAAHDEYIKEPRLMAEVLKALLVQPEEEKVEMTYRPAMTLDSSGNLGIGTQGRYATGHMDARGLWAAPVKGEGQSITGTTVNKMWFDEVTDTARTNFGTITREQFEDSRRTGAVRGTSTSVASQIYNRAFGRERVERDN